MFDVLDEYQNNGHFFFNKGADLSERSKDVPNLPGVFYIYRLADGVVDLVYIGKSGIKPESGLRSKIANLRDGVDSQNYFEQKIDKEAIDALDIYWFVTLDENHRDLPGFVEGEIMQQHYELHGSLPPWNQ